MTEPVDQYRIDCPSGHEVSVPQNLLGEELVCPRCNSRFVADIKASAEERDARMEKAARQWLFLAVTAASLLVFAGLLAALLRLLR